MTKNSFTGIERFFVAGTKKDMPVSSRTIFADGSAGSSFRQDLDLELSHWIPNTTPRHWSADTSTETCLRFIESPPDAVYDLVVNNHIDVDGILSVFALVQPNVALAHRDALIGAAEHGDLQASTTMEAALLAQELTAFVHRAYIDGEPLQGLYEEAFQLIPTILGNDQVGSTQALSAWAEIERGHQLLDDGTVLVKEYSDRLTGFVLPELGDSELKRALTVPPFSALIDESVWLWPHSRNRNHGQKAHLVTVPSGSGWFHDLWLPGYVWADTPDRWPVPGLKATGGSNEWKVDSSALRRSITHLAEIETATGRWTLANTFTPFATTQGRGFPVVAFFAAEDGRPTTSNLPPDIVGNALAKAFD